MRMGSKRKLFILPFMAGLAAMIFVLPSSSYAKSAKEIDASADAALQRFEKEIYGGSDLIKKAKGLLIFPKVIKGGIGIGAEYGEGVLRVGGKTTGYYNTIGGSFGFQLGAQVKSVFLLFMEESALNNFRSSSGWKAGVDGSVALVSIGADGSVDTTKTNEPIVGVVLGQKGLMYNLTLEGSKFNEIEKY